MIKINLILGQIQIYFGQMQFDFELIQPNLEQIQLLVEQKQKEVRIKCIKLERRTYFPLHNLHTRTQDFGTKHFEVNFSITDVL